MKRIHIVGGKNQGKTTLIADLVRELRARGLVVGTIKHTHHRHELDTPGKDSHRHREAGAAVVGVLSQGLSAVFVPTQELGTADEDRYDALAPMFAGCDVVLVEGDASTSATKIEVWRAALQSPPKAASDPSIVALITDDPAPLPRPTLPRSDLTALVDWLMTHRG